MQSYKEKGVLADLSDFAAGQTGLLSGSLTGEAAAQAVADSVKIYLAE